MGGRFVLLNKFAFRRLCILFVSNCVNYRRIFYRIRHKLLCVNQKSRQKPASSPTPTFFLRGKNKIYSLGFKLCGVHNPFPYNKYMLSPLEKQDFGTSLTTVIIYTKCLPVNQCSLFRREEAIVMANLRKRVAACDLTRKRPTPEDQNANELENEQLDNRPLLPKVGGMHTIYSYSLNYRRIRLHKLLHSTWIVERTIDNSNVRVPKTGRTCHNHKQYSDMCMYVHTTCKVVHGNTLCTKFGH